MSDEELKQLVAANARAIGDLVASISDLRDIVMGHKQRIIRLEGKEVDTWGDYLTLLDRVRSLEEWKRKMEGEAQ